MSIREGISAYYDTLGFLGAVSAIACKLTSFPRTIAARAGNHPVRLRLMTTDVSVYRDIFLRGEYDVEIPFTPTTILDAGANIGMASIFYALRYPHAIIVAVEAERSNFEMLCRNVSPYPQIIPIHAALWKHNGYVSVCSPDLATGAFGKWGFVIREGSGIQVQAMTVPRLMELVGFKSIDLLKMDIEGAEKEVFESCDWIQHVRSLLVETHDRFKPGCSQAVAEKTLGYRKSERGEMTYYYRLSA